MKPGWAVWVLGAAAACASAATPEGRPVPAPDWATYTEMVVAGSLELRQVSQGFADAEGRAISLRAIAYPTAEALALTLPPTFYVRIEQVLVDRAVGPQFELARLAPRVAQARYEAALDGVIFRARQAFAAAIAAGERVDILRDHLARADELVRQSKALFDAGRVQRGEVARMEVRANLLRQQLEQARVDATAARADMAGLAGLRGEVQPLGKLGEEAVPELGLPALVQEAREGRADLHFLRTEKLASGQKLLLSTRPLYPRLALFTNPVFQPVSLGSDFDIGRNDNEPALSRREGNSQLPAGVQLTWTLFDGGASMGQKQAAGAEVLGQAQALAALEASLPGEIAHALAAFRAARENLEARVLSPSPQVLREAAETDYAAGRIRIADRVRAEDAVLEQELGLLEARLACSLSAAALDAARGRVVRIITAP